MMQFIDGGPDIPDRLLNEHEKGNVVFFCGAGISYPAGLPNFKGLVDGIYEKIGDIKSQAEDNAYNNSQYDTMLNLLQNRIMAGRKLIYNAIFDILKPCFILPGATDTHVALLKLAITKEKTLHLITTNFDRIFEKAKQQISKKIESQSAPSLPIPDSKWDSLVYLHGILSGDDAIGTRKNPDDVYDEKTDNLIVTSGDFGQAYLVQGWAAKFISKLFENYTVCFVGYSLNDPILRYMTDALAANQDKNHKAYIFSDYSSESERNIKQQEWDIRGIVPIFYLVSQHDHHYLHQTLKEWGNHYEKNRFTVQKEIIDQYIDSNPNTNTKENDFIGRLLWALSDNTGITARHFACRVPLPNFHWLSAFLRYEQEKAEKTNVGNHGFFFTNSINFLFDNRQSPSWTKISGYIADWLMKQINNPEVFKFILNKGEPLHPKFKEKIGNTLSDISEMKIRNNNDELGKTKKNYPDAIPSDLMYNYWSLLINDKFYANLFWNCQFQFFLEDQLKRWLNDFRNYGLTPLNISNLKKILSPKIILIDFNHYQIYYLFNNPEDWRIDFSNLFFNIDNNFIQTIAKQNKTVDYYLTLLEEFLLALKSGLLLLQIFSKNKNTFHCKKPSIQYFDLNNNNNNNPIDKKDSGQFLLYFIVNFWLKILEQEHEKATAIALSWFNEPYAVFIRLALYAATKDPDIPDKIWVSCLLNNENKYLWSIETKREKFRVLAERGERLGKIWQVKLENAILQGRPPIEDLSEEQRRFDIWKHLLKLQGSGLSLSPKAQDFINRFKADHLKCIEPDETNESINNSRLVRSINSFPKDYTESTTQHEMYQLLLDRINQSNDDNSIESYRYHITWSEYCSENAQSAFSILSQLFDEQHFIPDLWMDFFNVINDPDFLPTSIPEDKNVESKPIQNICLYAWNCPIACLILDLINFYLESKIQNNSQISKNIKFYFNNILTNTRPDFIYGKVTIAYYLHRFYCIDPQWTKQYLLPLLDWDKYEEAWVIWCGFCYSEFNDLSCHINNQLLSEIKSYFIATASHYDDLRKGGKDYNYHYAKLLVRVTLFQSNILTNTELRYIYNTLPCDALYHIIQIFNSYLNDKKKELIDFWKGYLQPFFEKIWPKSKDKFTNQTVCALIGLCIQNKGIFPVALQTFENWLKPLDDIDLQYLLSLINNHEIIQKYPEKSLELLSKIINHSVQPQVCLFNYLQKIIKAKPELEQDPRFQQLQLYC